VNSEPKAVILEQLRSAISSGRAILFVGSGVSLSATAGNRFASWIGLIGDGIEWCAAGPADEHWARRKHEELKPPGPRPT